MGAKRALTWTAVSALAVLLVLPSMAGAVILPDPDPGPTGNSLIYGNFYVYSLQYLDNLYEKQGTPADFYVASSPGQIADDIVIFTGTNGTPEVVNPGAAGQTPQVMDNAFAPDQVGPVGSVYFSYPAGFALLPQSEYAQSN